MPTVNPRVNITVKPHQYVLLGRLAKLQKTSRAALVRDLFEQVYPVLERVAVLAEAAAKASQDVKDRLGEVTHRAERDMLPLLEKAVGQLDMFIGQAVQEMEATGRGARAPRGGLRSRRGPAALSPLLPAGLGPPLSNHGGQVRQPVDSKVTRKSVRKVGKRGRR